MTGRCGSLLEGHNNLLHFVRIFPRKDIKFSIGDCQIYFFIFCLSLGFGSLSKQNAQISHFFLSLENSLLFLLTYVSFKPSRWSLSLIELTFDHLYHLVTVDLCLKIFTFRRRLFGFTPEGESHLRSLFIWLHFQLSNASVLGD